MRHVIPISGKDSCATAIFQMARKPGLDYELFFNDVGCELPETYEWLDKVEKVLKRPIHRVGKSLEEVIFKYGILPSAHARFCTREAKIKPMEEFIGDDEAAVYFGIRADENRTAYNPIGKRNIFPCYPLVEAGIGLPQVFLILDKQDLRPPKFFWESVYRLVEAKLEKKYQSGFKLYPSPKEIFSKIPSWLFDQLFAWRSRSNCFLCFFQRRYEWAGLLEHHPDLFDRAEQIEREVGASNEDREKDFTWIAGMPLDLIRQNREMIMKRRAIQIIKILGKRQTTADPVDLLSVTSCGLFCGK